MNNEAYIYDSLRTPMGKGGKDGALHEVKPVSLVSILLNALAERNSLDTSKVEDLILGCVTPVKDQGGNIAKAALIDANWSESVPGFQLNRQAASGLEAINLAAMKIRSGWESMIVAGGVESMSRVPIGMDGGAMIFDPSVSSRACYIPYGVAADLVATIEGYSQAELDEWASLSQKRLSKAVDSGFFNRAMVPIRDQNNLVILEKDETSNAWNDLAELSSLKPAFEEIGQSGFDQVALHKFSSIECINHFHTRGNSASVVDGAGLVLLGSKEMGEVHNLKPRAKILSVGTGSLDPTLMIEGAAPAALKAIALAGKKLEDIDLFEIDESYASGALKFQKQLGISIDKINVNGGAIGLGSPLGASGAIMMGHLLDEMERSDLKLGLVAMSAGGGMGVATLIERE